MSRIENEAEFKQLWLMIEQGNDDEETITELMNSLYARYGDYEIYRAIYDTAKRDSAKPTTTKHSSAMSSPRIKPGPRSRSALSRSA